MLSILLLILKMIGLLLLFILIFILCLLLVILFVPIRYKFKVLYNKNQNQSNFTIHWLLHFIHVNVSYKNEININIRILGISVETFKKIINFMKKLKPNKKVLEKKTKLDIVLNEVENKNKTQISSEIKTETKDKATSEVESESKDKANSEFESESKNKKHKINIPDFFEKITNLFEKYSEKYYNVKRLLELNDRDIKSISFIKNNVLLILKHIMPRKIKGKLYFGFSDPSKTGYTLGIISIFNNLTYKNFDIQANFQEEALECDFRAKGRIRLVSVIFILLKVYFNKGVKRLIKRAKRIKKAIKA